MLQKECWARKAFITQLRIEIVKKQRLPHHHFTSANLKSEAIFPCYTLLIDSCGILRKRKREGEKGEEELTTKNYTGNKQRVTISFSLCGDVFEE